ncbi:TIGR00725 family protein [Methanolobus chelungpuianus]|uniref:TIGR00725 family protein n=1 Tax=Methanolobus chelungpuianus TaxID=502115 RepID=A0AAE3KYM9_9EURY|nr:TIGR00725 family protein [Methanolobus chelungpuianus]MCQ6962243.1 hypothetical protein [Methanolobus chelungpuianus]
MRPQIGVIGAGACEESVGKAAEEVGREIAKRNASLICGGRSGVMEAAARGAKMEGGTTIGILPGDSRHGANPFIDIFILSNMGHARNAIIAQSCDVLIAIGGEYGTLSEIALALKMGKKVVTFRSKWEIEGTVKACSPAEAVELAMNGLGV